jgi:hypothetical protein
MIKLKEYLFQTNMVKLYLMNCFQMKEITNKKLGQVKFNKNEFYNFDFKLSNLIKK